jgi:hypothetical protein
MRSPNAPERSKDALIVGWWWIAREPVAVANCSEAAANCRRLDATGSLASYEGGDRFGSGGKRGGTALATPRAE